MPDQKPSNTPKKKPASKTVGKPLADIAKPNKGSLDTGSRPIIVSRKPVVDDPMVTKTANDSTTAPATEDTRPMKDLLKAGRKELILSPTDEDGTDHETTKPQPGETINAGGDEAAAAEKSKAAESVNFEDLPVDESEEEEKSYVDALANDKSEDSTDETDTDKKEDLPSEVEVAEAEADDAPEVAEPLPEEKPVEAKSPKKPAPKKVITPDASDTAEEDAEKADEPKKEKEQKEQTQDEFTGDSVVQEPEGGLVDELAKQTADKKEQQVQDKKMEAQQEKIEELTLAKTYYVKTSKLSKRRVRNAMIIILLLLIIAVIGANFAIDAELLDVGVEPLTNIL